LKRQWVKVTRGSLYAAVAHAVIDAVEGVFDESFDLLEVAIPSYLLSFEEVVERLRVGPLTVTVRVPSYEGVLGEYELDNGSVIRVLSSWGFEGDSTLRSLYETAPVRIVQADSSLIREAALETGRTGVEYIYLYSHAGSLIALEGERGRVRIPFARVAFSLHTHPPGACGLSLADVQSGLDLLSEGGLAEAAATSRCVYIMYREGLVLEDDYIKIRGLRGRRGEAFDPGRLSLRSVKFQVVYY
jgi:hypothetical protein